MRGFMQLLLALGFVAISSSAAEKVFIDQVKGRFRVVSSTSGAMGVNGSIRGAGGYEHLAEAAASGADAVRIWGPEYLETVVPQAEANGLKISAGIWLPHDKSFYANCSNLDADPAWNTELQTYLAYVRRWKNSSAILWWTAGNEMEMEVDPINGNECVWRRVDWVAKAIKAEDPDHPVGTVIAGIIKEKTVGLLRYSPSVEFLGMNVYGDDSLGMGSKLISWGWNKPYAVMEFGPTGHWASPLTAWGAYIEESSTAKVVRYKASCSACLQDDLCIGAFAFVWGWKWEKTGTWYGMFNEWGAVTLNVGAPCRNCESETVGAMARCWKGTDQVNQPPSIQAVKVDGVALPAMRFSADQKQVQLEVVATQPQGRPLTAIWAVTEEVVSEAIGGAFEATNPLVPQTFLNSTKATVMGLSTVLNTSQLEVGRAYRMYVFVRQDPKSCLGGCPTQEATASIPFYICHTATAQDECYSHVLYAKQYGWFRDPQSYPGVNRSSSFEEFQMSLAQKGVGNCPMPCGIVEWCYTTVPGEECHWFVRYALMKGITESPDLYPGLTNKSTVEDVQDFLYKKGSGVCAQPCNAVTLPCEPNCNGALSRGSQRTGSLSGTLALVALFLAASSPQRLRL